jgi:hypothetical protein
MHDGLGGWVASGRARSPDHLVAVAVAVVRTMTGMARTTQRTRPARRTRIARLTTTFVRAGAEPRVFGNRCPARFMAEAGSQSHGPFPETASAPTPDVALSPMVAGRTRTAHGSGPPCFRVNRSAGDR